MHSSELVMNNPRGLHLRVAAEIVRLTRAAKARVWFSRDNGRTAAGGSIMDLLLLEASPGAKVRLEVDGPDEKEVAGRITELFSDGAGI